MQKVEKISEKLGITFGFAMMMLTMVVTIAGAYIAFFLTDLTGLSAVGMGVILLVGGIADVVSCFFVGILVQNTNLRWGKYRSWALISPLATIIGYVLLFVNWPIPEGAKVILLCMLYAIAAIGSNLQTLSQNGLISKITQDPDDRVNLVGRQQQGHAAARVVSGMTFLPLVALLGRGNDVMGYLGYFLIFGIISAVMNVLIFKMTKRYDPYVPESKLEKEVNVMGPKDMWNVLRKNDQFIVLILTDLLNSIGLMVGFVAMPYFFTYMVGDISGMTFYLSASSICQLLGCFVGPIVTKKWDKKPIFIFGVIAYGISFPVVYITYLITGVASAWLFIVMISFGSFSLAMQNPLKPTMFMDTAEYGYQKYGKNATSFILTFAPLPIKGGNAIAGGIFGICLSIIGYSAGMAITPALSGKLMFVIFNIPIVFVIIALLIFTFGYKLNRNNLAEIRIENEKKLAEINR
ncbi:MAG: MFS transporter [Eubacteriales bacterium]